MYNPNRSPFIYNFQFSKTRSISFLLSNFQENLMKSENHLVIGFSMCQLQPSKVIIKISIE